MKRMKKNTTSSKAKAPRATVRLTPRQVAFICNAMEAFKAHADDNWFPRKAWDEEAYKSLRAGNGPFDIGRSGIGTTVCWNNENYVWKDNEEDDRWKGWQSPKVIGCSLPSIWF